MRAAGVVVPVNPNAVRLVLHVNLGARTVTVPFRQRRYEPWRGEAARNTYNPGRPLA